MHLGKCYDWFVSRVLWELKNEAPNTSKFWRNAKEDSSEKVSLDLSCKVRISWLLDKEEKGILRRDNDMNRDRKQHIMFRKLLAGPLQVELRWEKWSGAWLCRIGTLGPLSLRYWLTIEGLCLPIKQCSEL